MNSDQRFELAGLRARSALFLVLATVAASCGTSKSSGAPDDSEASPVMQMTAQVRAEAERLESESAEYMARAKGLRTRADQLRAAEKTLTDDATRAPVKTAIDALTREIDAWESMGKELRDKSQKLGQAARPEASQTSGRSEAGEPSGGKPAASPIMEMAAQVLAHADSLESVSTRYIARGNRLRKKVGQLRVAERKLADDSTRETVKTAIDALVREIDAWETNGKEVRASGRQLGQLAHMLLIDGFDDGWERWISNPGPLVMEAVEFQVVAHNARIRTVQPSKLGLMPAAADMPEKHQGMSIRVPTLSGQNAPDELNVSSFQVSRERNVFAHVEVEPSGKEPDPVPLNRIHEWRLLVSDLAGNPVEKATIEVEGHMPGHVHGLPTQPRVTGEVAPGVYRVEGMKFQMNGWWVMQFNVEHDGSKGSVRFNLVL